MATPIPENRARFSLAEVVTATRGEVIHEGALSAIGVTTDSRALKAGNVFVALRGERFDGHDHIPLAIERGASIILSSREIDGDRASVVRVPDTLKALGDLARAHRRRWARRRIDRDVAPRVIAITGSAGKTTTRHAVSEVMRGLGFSVHASEGNLNNAIGVPMTLLGLTAEHDLAVIEVGTSRRGEIASNAAIVEPDVAVLTLVAHAHGEGIGTVWDVAAEKGDLFVALHRSGVAIANADDPRAEAQLLRADGATMLSYGSSPLADVRMEDRANSGVEGASIGLAWGTKTLRARVPLLGRAGAYAVAAAVATALAIVGKMVSSRRLASILEAMAPNEPGRLEPIVLGEGILILSDAYNANPASMESSIETAAELSRSSDGRLLLVLGEMRELGEDEVRLHELLGTRAASFGPKVLLGVGGASMEALLAKATHPDTETLLCATADDAARELTTRLQPKDVVLVKGSNSLGLTKVVAALKATRGKGAT